MSKSNMRFVVQTDNVFKRKVACLLFLVSVGRKGDILTAGTEYDTLCFDRL